MNSGNQEWVHWTPHSLLKPVFWASPPFILHKHPPLIIEWFLTSHIVHCIWERYAMPLRCTMAITLNIFKFQGHLLTLWLSCIFLDNKVGTLQEIDHFIFHIYRKVTTLLMNWIKPFKDLALRLKMTIHQIHLCLGELVLKKACGIAFWFRSYGRTCYWYP